MFGFGRSRNLRGALIAGAGMLAYRWWRNRNTGGQETGRGSRGGTSGRSGTSGAQGGFAAGGTTPGGSAF